MNALLSRRLDHLRRALATLDRQRTHARHNLYVSEVHLDALIGAVRAGVAEAEAVTEASDIVQHITDAERDWQLVRWVLDGRRDPEVGRWLQLADLWVADGYTALATAAGDPDALPPLVVPEAAGTPLVYRRGQQTEVPSLWSPEHRNAEAFRVRLDLPIVLYPPDQVANPWFATTLMHELGHELVRHLELLDGAQRAVASAGGSRKWGFWAEELLCDAIAVVLCGPAFGRTLARVLRKYPGLEEASRSYPSRPERLAVLAAVGIELKDDPAPLQAALDEAGAEPSGFAEVARALVQTPLGTTTLGQAITDRRAWLAALPVALDPASPLGATTWRSLPAAAALAVDDGSPGDTLVAIADAVLSRAVDLPRPSWVRDEASWALVAATLLELVPTLRDRDGGKGSPVSLFADATTLAFVAATNQRLPGWLDQAFERRGAPWERVEVAFLSHAGMDDLWGADAATARKEHRDAALAALRRQLPEQARAWAIYEVGHPYFFAAYYDHEQPWGRIHASWAVPGTEDLRFTPSTDFVWAGAKPPEAYQVFAQGLASLRGRASRLDGSPVASP